VCVLHNLIKTLTRLAVRQPPFSAKLVELPVSIGDLQPPYVVKYKLERMKVTRFLPIRVINLGLFKLYFDVVFMSNKTSDGKIS
jgi:hypothetical protein